jgi:hypothetical protein
MDLFTAVDAISFICNRRSTFIYNRRSHSQAVRRGSESHLPLHVFGEVDIPQSQVSYFLKDVAGLKCQPATLIFDPRTGTHRTVPEPPEEGSGGSFAGLLADAARTRNQRATLLQLEKVLGLAYDGMIGVELRTIRVGAVENELIRRGDGVVPDELFPLP